MRFNLQYIALSLPVAFQNPAAVALFVRVPVGYFFVLVAEEIPLRLFLGPYLAFLLEIPRLNLVKVNVLDHVQINPFRSNLLSEIIIYKFFVGGMESETWRNAR